jgi:hypothetical protein
MNFGFTMKYNKTGTNLQGNINIIYRAPNNKIYQIKSNAVNSLTPNDIGTAGRQATINSKAEFREIRGTQVIVLKGNLDLTVVAFESSTDKTGKSDKISVRLINPAGGTFGDGNYVAAGLIFTNDLNASTGASMQTQLSGGKIQVRNSTGISSASTVDESTRYDNTAPGTFKVSAYPNPTQHYFTLNVLSASNEPIEVKMFDMTGHMVYYRKGLLKEEHHKFGQLLTDGMYILDVRQGTNRSTTTLIKK